VLDISFEENHLITVILLKKDCSTTKTKKYVHHLLSLKNKFFMKKLFFETKKGFSG